MDIWSASINVQPFRSKYYLKIKGEIEVSNVGISATIIRLKIDPSEEDYPQFEVNYDFSNKIEPPEETIIKLEEKFELAKSDIKWIKSKAYKEKIIVMNNKHQKTRISVELIS